MKRMLARWFAIVALCCGGARAQAPAAPVTEAVAPQVMVMLTMAPQHFRADAGYAGAYRNEGGRPARRRIALDLARQHGLKLVSDWPMPVLGVDCYVLSLPAGADASGTAALLARDARVEWAQPVQEYRALASGDPLYPVQPGAAQWRLDDLHRTATGRQVTVAVIDSGVDDRHPDLAGQVALKENFIEGRPYLAEHHGTAVAGIIAALAGNGIGIRGIAPGARLMSLRACREQGSAGAQCDSFSLAKALNFAIQRTPQVINMSLTGPADRLLQRLLDAAMARGIAVVGAADPGSGDGGFPASWPGVLAVGAETAPAHDIPTTVPGGGFGMVSGSSYSSAHVSGLLALLGEASAGASAVRIRGYLHGTAVGIAGQVPIDACAAMTRAASRCVCSCPLGAGLKVGALP